jgi:FkbM family methyltransferase
MNTPLANATKAQLMDAGRKGASAVQTSDNRILSRVLNRYMIYTDARDVSVTPYVFGNGGYDWHIVETMAALIKPNMVCADLGACFGFHTLVMADLVGSAGKVYSFECHPRLFPTLKNNIEINDFCTRVRPYPNAIGASAGSGELCLHRRRFNGSTLSDRAKASFGAQEVASVNISRLDDILIPNGANPDFYHISAVGYEPQIWEGMQGLLHAKRKITIIMNFCRRWYDNPIGFASAILDEGFIVQRLREDGHLETLLSPEQFGNPIRSDLLLTR